MISKSKAKFIKSLQLKKYRKQEQCFLVEGEKGVLELLNSHFELVLIAATPTFIEQHKSAFDQLGVEVIVTDERQLATLGAFQSNNSCLAVARQKSNQQVKLKDSDYALVLDEIKDPGNLGTIIRTADWYGIKQIIASSDTTDFYSPKVISATMGSFTRVLVNYQSLPSYLHSYRGSIYGALLDGEDVRSCAFTEGGLIVIGSESQGISPEVKEFVTHPITIPGFGEAESLNASVATGVILDNLLRLKK